MIHIIRYHVEIYVVEGATSFEATTTFQGLESWLEFHFHFISRTFLQGIGGSIMGAMTSKTPKKIILFTQLLESYQNGEKLNSCSSSKPSVSAPPISSE